MTLRGGLLLAVIALGAILPAAIGAQTQRSAAESNQGWTPPRTPDGQPDLQGVWTNGTLTPFERPVAQADKPFLTELDGRPHASSNVRLWTGDSRGRWEGATLVVDTTNFHNKGWITTHAGSGRLRGVPHSEALHLVERFTRVDADTMSYSMTIDDANVYARPWTFSLPLTRRDDYQIFEYACHEGNQATGLILRGARTLEREAADKKGDPQR